MSWKELNDRRRAVRRRWPKIWSVPVIPRSMRHAAALIPAGARVVDIGASDGGFGRKLTTGVEYVTVDVDPAVEADFRSLDGIADDSADFVACFETVEHVTLPEAEAILLGAARILKPGGLLFVSTPNVHHPWSFRSSATHLTPFPYDELGGLIEGCGFAVETMFRCHRDAALQSLLRFVARPLYRIVGVDYAKSLFIVAKCEQRSKK